MDFHAIRKEYESAGLDEGQMLECPLSAFTEWMTQATNSAPGDWFEVNAMTLATSDPGGNVTARIVLLKDITDSGLVFFTNYESEKGRQLAENPGASLLFHWPWLGRQVRIRGNVARTDRGTSEKYFRSRPRGSQISAAVSNQSATIDSREELQALASRLEDELAGAEVPCPESWGGFELVPVHFEFWQGRPDRLHDRILYQRSDAGDSWSRSRLAP